MEPAHLALEPVCRWQVTLLLGGQLPARQAGELQLWAVTWEILGGNPLVCLTPGGQRTGRYLAKWWSAI